MSERIQIRVDGLPIPQGSKGAKVFGRRAILFDTNSTRLEPWRDKVRDTARDQCRYHDTITGAFRAWMRFTFERPAAHYRTGRNAHRLRDQAPVLPTGHDLGDVDKLQRAIFDSLQAAGVIHDDCLCVDVRARKVYAGEDEYALPAAGVVIVLEPLEDATQPAVSAAALSPAAADTVHPSVQEALL